MEKVSEAVLEKIRGQAAEIVEAARSEAERELEKARRRREERMRDQAAELEAQADAEVNKILSKGRMEARNRVAAAKARILDAIIDRARQRIDELETDRDRLAALIADAVAALGSDDKVVVGVAEKDLEPARELVATDSDCKGWVAEVATRPIGGGAVVERGDGAIVVDNSHRTRLEMLIPRVKVRIRKELF